MRNALRDIRGAVLMGLAWAVVWLPVGLLVGLIVDPDESMDEPWVLVGTFPGFLCGALFYAALRFAGGRRELDELSLPRSGALGAVSGLLVGVLPFVLGTPNERNPQWLAAVVIGSVTVLGAVSAPVSVALARWWRGRTPEPLNPARLRSAKP